MSNTQIDTSITISSISLNYNNECLLCTTNQGFIVYTLNPFNCKIMRNFTGGLRLGHMYKATTLYLINGTGTNDKFPINRVSIWDDHNQKIKAEISLNSRILGLYVSDGPNVIVSSNRKTYIYEIESLTLLKVFDICSFSLEAKILKNDFIICNTDFTNKDESTIMIRRKNRCLSISAHQRGIGKIAISNDGQYIATTSINGIIIKIFNLLNGNLITEFRRGSFSKTISYLGFSESNDYLLCGTINGSVHLFNIKQDDATIDTLWGILRRRSNYSLHINDQVTSISLIKNNTTLYIITNTKFYSCIISEEGIIIQKTSLLIYKRDPFTPSPKQVLKKTKPIDINNSNNDKDNDNDNNKLSKTSYVNSI